ncbi:hypothetical protein GCM10020221_13480 [Streptomyces thioluteus]|uniref:Uncharacterized protein n=1 Tax=Streptomyces thioluteus TaxID=66431 RepID=A0ABP6J2Y0_STRTU
MTTPTLPSIPLTPSSGAAAPARPGLQFAVGERVAGVVDVARTGGEYGAAGRAPVQRVPEPGAVRHVVVRPGRLDDGDGERLRPVDERQVGGGPHVLGQRPQRGQGGLPHERVHLAAEPQHPQAHPGPAADVPPDERVLLQCGEQPVDHGPVDPEPGGQLGDGQSVIRVGEQFQDTQSSVERLRSLRGHDAPSSDERRALVVVGLRLRSRPAARVRRGRR